MKIGDIRDLQDQDLNDQITKNREQLFKFRFHAKNEEMQRAGEIRKLRRDIARMKTILQERRIKNAAGTGAENG